MQAEKSDADDRVSDVTFKSTYYSIIRNRSIFEFIGRISMEIYFFEVSPTEFWYYWLDVVEFHPFIPAHTNRPTSKEPIHIQLVMHWQTKITVAIEFKWERLQKRRTKEANIAQNQNEAKKCDKRTRKCLSPNASVPLDYPRRVFMMRKKREHFLLLPLFTSNDFSAM